MATKSSDNEEQQESIDQLMEKIQAGANARANKDYLSGYIYARIWQTVTMMANLPASENATTLIDLKARLKEAMLMAQELKLDTINAEVATKKLKELYEAREIDSRR